MSQEKILVIDDEKNIRLTLEKCLAEEYEVLTAVNGEDGLDKFSQDEFAVVLLDMKLPGIDGLEVLEKIKTEAPATKVIMITGFGSVETAVETMKLGAVDYLRKPFTPEEIRNIVSEVLNRQQEEVETEELSSYDDYLSYAKSLISQQEFEAARDYLEKALSFDSSQPEPFNLLGLILEMQDRSTEAQKKYRAALALDPTYKPAQANLDRASQFGYDKEEIDLDELVAEEE